MPVPEIIDVHVHMCRDRAQEKLVFPRKGFPDEWYWCNPENVIPYMDRESISHLFIINFMNTHEMMHSRLRKMKGASEAELKKAEQEMIPEMIQRIKTFNTWAIDTAKNQPRLIPFVNVDIGHFYTEKAMMEELEEKVKMGARGVKFSPEGSKFQVNDPRMNPLYDYCQTKGIPILSDTGAQGETRGNPTRYAEPINFIHIFKNYPRLKFIMAHLCSAYWDERIEIAREFPQVYFDTAGGFHNAGYRNRDGQRACSIEDAVRLLRTVGTHRVLFGSDAPGSDPRPQYQAILHLDLTDAEKQQILAGNAKQLLNIK